MIDATVVRRAEGVNYLLLWHAQQREDTDIPGYSDTGYSDTPLIVTLLKVPLLHKSVTISRYLLTVTLLASPEGVTVSGDICISNIYWSGLWVTLSVIRRALFVERSSIRPRRTQLLFFCQLHQGGASVRRRAY